MWKNPVVKEHDNSVVFLWSNVKIKLTHGGKVLNFPMLNATINKCCKLLSHDATLPLPLILCMLVWRDPTRTLSVFDVHVKVLWSLSAIVVQALSQRQSNINVYNAVSKWLTVVTSQPFGLHILTAVVQFPTLCFSAANLIFFL